MNTRAKRFLKLHVSIRETKKSPENTNFENNRFLNSPGGHWYRHSFLHPPWGIGEG
jgi:hypothetical protein